MQRVSFLRTRNWIDEYIPVISGGLVPKSISFMINLLVPSREREDSIISWNFFLAAENTLWKEATTHRFNHQSLDTSDASGKGINTSRELGSKQHGLTQHVLCVSLDPCFYWWGQKKLIQLPIFGDVNIHLVNGPPKLEVSCSTQANVFTFIHKKSIHDFVHNFLDTSSPWLFMEVEPQRITCIIGVKETNSCLHTEISRNLFSWRLM